MVKTKRQKAFYSAAESFLIPVNKRTPIQRMQSYRGICYATSIFFKYGQVELPGEIFLLGIAFGLDSYWLPTRLELETYDWLPKHDTIRGMFCLLMATLSDKEWEEIVGDLNYKAAKTLIR